MPECGTQCHGLVNVVMVSEVFSNLIDPLIPHRRQQEWDAFAEGTAHPVALRGLLNQCGSVCTPAS